MFKDEFYDNVLQTYGKCSIHDVKTTIGNANAQNSKEREELYVMVSVIGKHNLRSITIVSDGQAIRELKNDQAAGKAGRYPGPAELLKARSERLHDANHRIIRRI